MSNIKKSFLMGGAAAGAALVASAFFSVLAVQAACSNPATIPTGFAAPCPVFSLSSTTVTQAQTLTLSALPQPGTDYIYTTAYVSQGTAWNPYTLQGNNAYPAYSSALASLTLSGTQLQALSLGTHYAVVWDWLWDATANCYKGPGLNQCNTGAWRVQSFSLTSSYAYSQSSYYAYSQSAYTSGPFISISPTTLNFGSITVGQTSAILYATLTNTGNASLTFASSSITGDFAFGGLGSCATTLAVGASCTYSAKFTPTTSGTRTGAIIINDNATNTPQTINLTGTGVTSYTYSQSSYTSYTYSQSSYYVYSQSSYYAYSQSAYYAYSQAAYTSSCTKTISTVFDLTYWASNAAAGNTICVAPGTYNFGSSYLVSSANGTASSPVRFISTTQWGAKIIGTGADVWATSGSYEDIIGFDISSGGTNTNQLIQIASPHVRILGNKVHDMPNTTCLSGAGVHLGTGSNYVSVIGNYVYNIGEAPTAGCNQAHGIYVSTPHNIIENNILFNNEDLGIQLWGSGVAANDVSYNIITNNTIFGNWRGIVIGNGNSTLSTGNYVANNILYKNIQYGMYESGGNGTDTVTNNLNYGNGTAWGLTTDTAVNSVAADPQFVSYTGTTSGNYHLQSTSPAINAGISTNAPSKDYDGGSRPINTYYDIGAYEYGSTAGSWPWY